VFGDGVGDIDLEEINGAKLTNVLQHYKSKKYISTPIKLQDEHLSKKK